MFPGSSTTETGLFHLDQVTGILTTTSNSFDRDTATGGVQYYDVTVKAIDQGSPVLSVERTVRVGLTDVNDNTPTFAQNIYTVSIPESTTAGLLADTIKRLCSLVLIFKLIFLKISFDIDPECIEIQTFVML